MTKYNTAPARKKKREINEKYLLHEKMYQQNMAKNEMNSKNRKMFVKGKINIIKSSGNDIRQKNQWISVQIQEVEKEEDHYVSL